MMRAISAISTSGFCARSSTCTAIAGSDGRLGHCFTRLTSCSFIRDARGLGDQLCTRAREMGAQANLDERRPHLFIDAELMGLFGENGSRGKGLRAGLAYFDFA